MQRLMVGLCLLCPAVGLAQPFGYSLASSDLSRFELPTGVVVESQTLAEPSDSVGMTMLASGELLSLDSGGDLWRIDPQAGTATRIGATGVTVGLDAGLTQDACGTVWIADDSNLYSADPSTGAATLVSPLAQGIHALTSHGTSLLGLAGVSEARLVRIDPNTGEVEAFGDVAPSGPLQGLDFDADGRLWAVAAATPPFGFYAITEFDPNTGSILQSQLFAVGFGVFDGSLAMSPPQGVCGNLTDVPISPVAAWILVVALGVVGVLWSRSV